MTRAMSVWVAGHWRALVSEAVATALLLVLGVGTTLPYGAEGAGGRPLTEPALGWGAVVAALVAAFGGASGAHMNPAVTLGALLYGALGWGAALGYCAAQCAGAGVGCALLAALVPAGALAAGGGGVTRPGAGVGAAQAAALEALQTGTLVLVACGLWRAHVPARPDPAAPLKLGLTVSALVYAAGPLTGTSLNPARSAAPALVWGPADHLWLYVVGPLAGAAAAALLHRHVLAPHPPPSPPLTPPPPSQEELPLRHKRDSGDH